jgi:hypothetical protein
MDKDELRNEILEKVKQYYKQKTESQFIRASLWSITVAGSMMRKK